MKRVGTARRGIYVSDGTVNVALLKIESADEKPGLYHFGMWVDDLAAAEDAGAATPARAISAAARPRPNPSTSASTEGPDGIVFDLTHTGWVGAVKEVEPKV